ncbi:MAG: hypothetical protein U0264_18245 [Candidatus Kapaibacterium sp.]
MFELEIEQLKKFLIAKLPQAQPYVFLRDIISNEAINESYKRFFTGEVDWWLYEEQNQWLDHHRFDTSAPEFAPIFKQLDDALRHNAHFDHDVLLSTIDAAAKVRLNFLCRPRTTLKWFVYRGGPTKTIYEILLRLEYLADYSYLTKGFYAWARKTYSHYPAMDLLSVVEFQKIIETIDNEYILDLSPHQFVDLLEPLFEFFNPHIEDSTAWTVPTEALIVFLDDKKVDLIAKELERMLYEENVEQVSQEQFLEVVITILTLVESGELVPEFEVIDFNDDDDEALPPSETDTSIAEQELWEITLPGEAAEEEAENIPESEIPDDVVEESAEPESWETIPPVDVAGEITEEIPPSEISHEAAPEIAEPEFWEVVPPVDVAEEITEEIPTVDIPHETEPEIPEPEFWEVVPPVEVVEEIAEEIPTVDIPHETEPEIPEPEFWEVVPPVEVVEEIAEEIPTVDIPHETAPEIPEPEFWEVVPPVDVVEEITEEIPPSEISHEAAPEIPEPEFWEVAPPVDVAEEIAEEITEEIPPSEISHEAAPEISEPEFWEVVPPVDVAEEITGEIPPSEISHEAAPEIPEPEFWEVVPPVDVAGEIAEEIPEVEIPNEAASEIAEPEFREVTPPVDVAEEIAEEIPLSEISHEAAPEIAEPEFREVIPPIDVAEKIPHQEIAEIIDHDEQPALPRWETIIDSKLKEKFVKKLFDGNEGAYHKLLGELDDCSTWAKADAAIVRYFIRAKKKHTDSIAVEFGRTIQKRFLENQ